MDDEIIIKDADGTYKILKDGEFVSLDDFGGDVDMEKKAPIPPKEKIEEFRKKVPLEERYKIEKKAKNVEPKLAIEMKKPEKREQKKPEPTVQRPQASKEPLPVAPKEISHHKTLPKREGVPGLRNLELNQKAEALVAKSGITFASGEIRKRVVQNLIAYLKDIRKPFEVREHLQRSVMEGGTGLSDFEAEQILVAAGVQAQAKRPAPQQEAKTYAPVGQEISVPPRIVSEDSLPISAAAPTPPLPSKPAVAAKPAVSDISKPAHKLSLQGPGKQLAYDLTTWRRLAADPMERNKKIQTQLDVLQDQDGYAQRIQGWMAWKESEPYQMYLSAGRKSLEQNKPLPELLAQISDNQVSFEEWQAINELNRLMNI